MSFFCPSPVCLERERQYYRREKKKKKEREKDRKRKETIFEINSKIAVSFLVPFLFNLITTERTGSLSIIFRMPL